MKKKLLPLIFCAFFCGCSEQESSNEFTIEKKVNALLKNLERNPAPPLYNLAMHVDNFAPPKQIEYLCLVCDKQTIIMTIIEPLFGENIIWFENMFFQPEALEECRALVKEIQKLGLDAKFDERSFCAFCQTETDLISRSFYLDITLHGKTTRTELRVPNFFESPFNELVILKDFLEGKLIWHTEKTGDQLLKSQIPRIRQLLGLDDSLK